jgi:L-ascorbate metabolism protein UlaG (beta-lactamase superfamily)
VVLQILSAHPLPADVVRVVAKTVVPAVRLNLQVTCLSKEAIMKITWCGHACFLITTEDGKKILTDPYEPGGYGGALAYGKVMDEVDLVLVSHDHADHNYIQGLKGKPKVIRVAGKHQFQGVEFRGITTYHDTSQGKERGINVIFCFEVDGISLCHLGDLGHPLSDKELSQIGKVDILLIPVGGFYTIDAKTATEVVKKINPKITIPMHFKTEKCSFPITGVEEFTRGKSNFKNTGRSEVSITKDSLPQNEIWVLNHAL